MKNLSNSIRKSVYLIVVLVMVGSMDIMQIYNSDLEMLCFIEMMDGESESEEKESREKTAYDIQGNKASNNLTFSSIYNMKDVGNFGIREHHLTDVITPPPELTIL